MMRSFYISLKLVLSLAIGCRAAIGPDGICRPACDESTCTFEVRVNLFASELGHFQFDSCNGAINPTLGMEVGKTHVFVQNDQSNWMHPLGFAYFPDGAHDDVDELEPGIPPPDTTDQSCANDKSCPAPMYFAGGNYLGTYSNNANLTGTTIAGQDNFGLDDYEPQFFHPPADWAINGPWEVKVLFPEMDGFVGDIFYFCHIHSGMSGRIKLLKDDEPLQFLADLPKIDYDVPELESYDESCGTFGLQEWQLPHPQCPERFVCDVPTGSPELEQFSDCIESMNCHMFAGMTTGVKSEDEIALFIHQMIPHHQNAVNMAKALLKTNKVVCDSLQDESDDCVMKTILLEIVNTQNHQIQTMQSLLDSYNLPESDNCVIEITHEGDHADEAFYSSSISKVVTAAGAVLSAF